MSKIKKIETSDGKKIDELDDNQRLVFTVSAVKKINKVIDAVNNLRADVDNHEYRLYSIQVQSPFDEKYPDEPKARIEQPYQKKIRKLEKALVLAMKALNYTADTFQRGEEHERDVQGICELTAWNIEEVLGEQQ